MSASSIDEAPSATTYPASRLGGSGIVAAMVLCAVAAVLILFESEYWFAFGASIQTPWWIGTTLTAQQVGAFGVVDGLFLVAVGVLLLLVPRHHAILGVGILTLALLSLFIGGGFLVGAFLGYAASLFAIFTRPLPAPLPHPTRSVLVDMDDPVAEADLIDSERSDAGPGGTDG
ncbi:MAG: hypothetical protein ACRECT_06665 [Thermoplasmata archaeon]